MSAAMPLLALIQPDPEEQLERATARLDAALLEAIRRAFDDMTPLIGPNGATARIAGRVARVARLHMPGPLG